MEKTVIADELHRLGLNFERLVRNASIRIRLWETPLLTSEVLMAYVEALLSDQPLLFNRATSGFSPGTVETAARSPDRRGASYTAFSPAVKFVVLYRLAPVIWDAIDESDPDALTVEQRAAYLSSLHLIDSAFAGRFDPVPILDFPAFDENGTVVILDGNEGDHCGLVREVEIEGDTACVNDFLATAHETSRLLDGLPDATWKAFPEATREISIPSLRWIFCMFDLAWRSPAGSLLRPSIDRSILAEDIGSPNDGGSKFVPLADVQKFRGTQQSVLKRTPLTDVSLYTYWKPIRWSSAIDDAAKASIYAIDAVASRVLGLSLVPSDEPRYLYQKEGANYKVRFEGEQGDIPADLQGAKYLDELLHHPNTSYPATALRNLYTEKKAVLEAKVTHPEDEYEGRVSKGGQSHGSQLRERYEQVMYLMKGPDGLQQLLQDREEAKANGDAVKVTALTDEIGKVEGEINRVLGRGKITIDGTEICWPRRFRIGGTPSDEAARVAVTSAIDLIRKKCRTDWNLHRFARHLEAVRTGAEVVYRPPEPWPDWK